MKKYFTTLDLEDGKFVGSLHDPDTNQVVYKTKGYNSQSQVTSDINEYITKNKSNKNTSQPRTPQTTVNFIHKKAVTNVRNTCCGRG
jgi:hypothetical protein